MNPAPRYAISGAGTRAWKTYLPLFAEGRPMAAFGTLVGVCDTDRTRLEAVLARWSVSTYSSEHVQPMLEETRPDVLVITTPDHLHAGQVEAALAVGVSVLVEKPLAVTAEQAVAVVSAERRSNASVRVAHNMRYLNLHREIRRLLVEGYIGAPTRIAFSYRLTPSHGRSYFQRWHRRSEASGGLQITKSCHHFDLINWWLADRPVEVMGWTRRAHYLSSPMPGDDERLVPEDADIADEVDAVIRYRGGSVVHYSLSARTPWEGYTLTIQGTAGELTTRYEVVAPLGRELSEGYQIRLTALDRSVRHLTVPRESGSHSGADIRMLDALLPTKPAADAATATDGTYAVAMGEAVTRSAASGRPVAISQLLPPWLTSP